MEREIMHYDVVIVGAGPAGLAAAIRLCQQSRRRDRDLSICIIEKGAEVGAHILSGAVVDPRALDELLPDWHEKGAPLHTSVNEDAFWYLSERRHIALPGMLLPPAVRNHGNYIVSLANLCRWLAEQAEAMGVEIYPGFAAAEVLYHSDGAVTGVATGAMGLDGDGNPKDNYDPGVELHATYTLFAEGCRGSLAKGLRRRFKLERSCQPQIHALGIKELWEIEPSRHKPGYVLHTMGWPLDNQTYGGGWLYYLEDNLVSVGFVVGLDYTNPYLDPFAELQRFKTHSSVREMFEGGRRVGYGARVLNEGGYQCIPDPVFPGGAIIGASAGYMNVPRLKETHTAMKSGMLMADGIIRALGSGDGTPPVTLNEYPLLLEQSWIHDELYRARNVRPAFARWGQLGGLLYTGLDQWLLRGRAPWTLHHPRRDHESLQPAEDCEPIDYPRPDGIVSFDKLSSVSLSNTMHEADQPVHLNLKSEGVAIDDNLKRFAAPEQYYCPAGVYEIVRENNSPRLQINAQNCVHCKCCDIKDPFQNIDWVTPQGGDGPRYGNM